MNSASDAIKWAIDICSRHLPYVWGAGGPNAYDCSHFIYAAYGIPDQYHTTISMPSHLPTLGFADVSLSVDFATGLGMAPGDVLVQHHTAGSGHTAMVTGVDENGAIISHAKGSAYGCVTEPLRDRGGGVGWAEQHGRWCFRPPDSAGVSTETFNFDLSSIECQIFKTIDQLDALNENSYINGTCTGFYEYNGKEFYHFSDKIYIEYGTNIFDGRVWKSKTYNVSDWDIRCLTAACLSEQSGLEGVAKEASLICNQYEQRGYKYATSLRGWVAYSGPGYFYHSNTRRAVNTGIPAYGATITQDYLNVVEDVVRNGNRVLPWCIDEQDSRGDIYASGNISEGTLIRNVYGSRYYFYCWSNSDGSGDVFGYTGEYGYPDMSYQEIKGVL